MRIVLFILLIVIGCSSREITDVRVWQAMSTESSIVRKQDNSEIRCSDEEFNRFICIDADEFAIFFSNQCVRK